MPVPGKPGANILTRYDPARDEFGGVLALADGRARWATDKVIAGLRVSGPTHVTDGRLLRQEEDCLAAIRKEGYSPICTVGSERAQGGRLRTRRPDLVLGASLARRQDAILCYWDLTRLFRPAAYSESNRYAHYTPDDFKELRALVGDDVRLALILSPDVPLRELHIQRTKLGMERAMAEGRAPGRPRVLDERMAQRVAFDYQDGVSCREICRRYGLPRSTVRTLLAEIDNLCCGPQPEKGGGPKRG